MLAAVGEYSIHPVNKPINVSKKELNVGTAEPTFIEVGVELTCDVKQASEILVLGLVGQTTHYSVEGLVVVVGPAAL